MLCQSSNQLFFSSMQVVNVWDEALDKWTLCVFNFSKDRLAQEQVVSSRMHKNKLVSFKVRTCFSLPFILMWNRVIKILTILIMNVSCFCFKLNVFSCTQDWDIYTKEHCAVCVEIVKWSGLNTRVSYPIASDVQRSLTWNNVLPFVLDAYSIVD